VVTGGEGSGGGEAVEKDSAVRFFLRERERERGAVKLDLRGLTAVKRNGWFTLGKGIFFEDALFPLTPLRSRLSVKSIRIGASNDFLRTSEARSLQRFPRSFQNLNSRYS
jgi:hypothetical protein